ncbi:hypothetical protein IW144_003394 [Coemansia sp. RSA 522]|nr:hypothetical protein LPJ67_002427 [Coemansia sp. RSA 1938]KAJ2195553.1 hypothetical protein IW144_003394 [Coemansia sp. RSA 522]
MRLTMVRAAALLLVLTSPAAAFTRTSTDIGTETATYTTTDDGNVETITTESAYTSYIVFMNDNAKMSSFVGIPMTTTDKNGDESTYLSLEIINTEVDRQTFKPSQSSSKPTSSPTVTDEETATDSESRDAEPSSADKPSGAGKTNIGPIIGGAVGGVLVLVILGVVGWIIKRKRDRKKHLHEHQREEMQLLAMELDGSYKPGKRIEGGPLSDDSIFTDTRIDGSITDDLASRYTGGSMSRHQPMFMEAHSAGTQSASVGAELTMDSQGRMGLPDGSPQIMTCIMPLRNVKASDNYTDLEWFPLVGDGESELMHHPGPSYIEEKELSNVATYIQKSAGHRKF